MGNEESSQDKRLFRWFEYIPYNKNNEHNNNLNQFGYNTLLKSKGYLMPISINDCSSLEKHLNLNNQGLSTKYFFNYDYNDKLLSVKNNNKILKRLKIPISSQDNVYKIKRKKRFSKNSFKSLKVTSNHIKELKILFYKEIFNEFKVDPSDKFMLRFVNHYTIMHSSLINLINKNLKNHFKIFHEINKENRSELNFDKLKQMLIKEFKMYKNKELYKYPNFFLKNLNEENFDNNIIQMIIEEGELVNKINNIYNNDNNNENKNDNDNDVAPNLLLYLLCFQFSFDNKCNNKEIITCYKTIDNNNDNTNFNKEFLIKGNYLMNFEYMSVSKDKNNLNIYSNNDKEEYINNKNQIHIEIEFEKPLIKNWYLSFKSLDTENISQYPIEQEVIIQPYSIFEIREVKEMSNNNLYVKLYMKSNSLNELCGSEKGKEIRNNLCICDGIGDNIFETYPNINLENIVSMTIKNNNQLIKNKANIGLMKNLRILDISNISLTDRNINQLIPFLKNLNFLNYINMSLNNLSHKSLKLLSEIIPSFPFLEHIVLDQNSFGDDGIIALSDGLKKIDNLKSFSAVFNQIKTDGVEKLSNELKRYKNLYYLNLSNNYLFFEEIDDFVYAIKYMNNLIELNVSNNQISSEGICMIGEILPKTIQKLNFAECEIYQDGFSEFGTYLNRIPNLTSLFIYGNRNGPSGINSLLDGFEFCPHLSCLDFGCNRIEDCDMVLFIKKIRKIKNIKKLILKENYLTDSSILFLLDVINTLANLEMLDISWNSIEGSNLIEFIGILSKFEKLNCLNIEGNPCESNDINILLDILNQNNLNTKNKEKPNILWKYEKGTFIKENKIINIEDFVNKYNDN